MKKSYILAVSVFASFLILSSSSYATCLTPDTNPTDRKYYPGGSKVTYSIHSTIPSTSVARAQIAAAILAWNGFNALKPCNGIQFVTSGGTGPSLQFVCSSPLGDGKAAHAFTTSESFGYLRQAVIAFHPTLTQSSVLVYDPDEDGYDKIFYKMAMHEIGHLMGLNHYNDNYSPPDQHDGSASVMKDGWGVNDSHDNISELVLACDAVNLGFNFACFSNDGTCNSEPDFTLYPSSGCASGFANIGTFCGMGFEEQATCSDTGDYDPESCSCQYPTPSPTPTPTPTPTSTPYYCVVSPQHSFDCIGATCDEDIADCAWNYGTWEFCTCTGISPIIVDINGNGFNLTNPANGVLFDFNGDGVKEQISWTPAYSDDAWLVLDRNGNSLIDNAGELFGNYSDQPVAPPGIEKNGFLALAEYDKFENGGNGDRFITKKDMIFRDLKLWQDTNHNGISESSEIATLPQLGLRKMQLDYQESRRTDEFGNKFKYKARVKDAQDAQLGRWAWDVFLQRAH